MLRAASFPVPSRVPHHSPCHAPRNSVAMQAELASSLEKKRAEAKEALAKLS